MPSLSDRFKKPVPSYRLHRPSGLAVVTLDGTDIYLGPFGSPASHGKYDRVTAEWLANGRKLPAREVDGYSVQDQITVVEMLAAFWNYAEEHYRKDGQPTSEIKNLRCAVRLLVRLYGHTNASDFGPLALKAIQQQLIADDVSRGVINSRIGKIKRVFRWAVSEQLVPPSTLHGLESVMGLQRGRTKARETGPVLPVSNAIVDATLPFLPPVVADMVRLQRLTGCRPGEVRGLRPCDVDRTGKIWEFRPASHKTQHHGRQRVIFIGPQAQEVLSPYLARDSEAHCFSPAESRARQLAEMRSKRRTKVQPSQIDRSKKRPQTMPGTRYAKDAYNQAIHRACKRADKKAHDDNPELPQEQVLVPSWHPNQLRHSLATSVRAAFGIEAAQVILGHSSIGVTQVYAERDKTLGTKVMEAIG